MLVAVVPALDTCDVSKPPAKPDETPIPKTIEELNAKLVYVVPTPAGPEHTDVGERTVHPEKLAVLATNRSRNSVRLTRKSAESIQLILLVRNDISSCT